MPPYTFVGLGNPGAQYAHTRHNLGFDVLDRIASGLNRLVEWKSPTFIAARGAIDGTDLVLVKPVTFMNNSGEAVRDLLDGGDSVLDRLGVITDDLALPLGTIRIRIRGSHGGHNGLRSIIDAIGTEELTRVRCGIGTDPMPLKDETAGFVLSPFDREEHRTVEEMIARAGAACLMLAREGPHKAMNSFNT